MSDVADDWMAPATCSGRRVRVRRGRSVYEWGIRIDVNVYLYDGATLHLDVALLSFWLRTEIRLFYSQRMLRRSWDRWQAECLAGEHRGVTLNTEPRA